MSPRSVRTPLEVAAETLAIPLTILDTAPQRPLHAQGPRSLSSVRLLRLSVTDRCNLRCLYCMPAGGIDFADRDELLGPRDFEAVAATALGLGVESLKLTGGEPTVRGDLIEIVGRLAALRPRDLSMTTNGMQLRRLAGPLRAAGMQRLTLSLDSLDPERFRRMTGGGRLELFWDGVAAALEAGFERLKFNVVVVRGINDDEVEALAALSLDRPWTIRFIEYMPLGESVLTLGDPNEATVDNAAVRERLVRRFGGLEPVGRHSEPGVGPASVWNLPGAAGRVGFISAMSKPFCETCNRLRLTATGELRSCLFDGGEVDLLPALRPIPDRAALAEAFAACVVLKPTVHSARGDRAMSQLGG
ncbi:MAG TPA: GTP 3',8-cyclase MoaA [Phycisphaerales bacterium]|mgnify:CR=1 FL=1|nr:GTP 3',8-cyclase MoaA [Phycisphaerales bacterium]HMP37594.1 GTP 3',8-cyclase MoaA [Phycisphaerales bacterium]